MKKVLLLPAILTIFTFYGTAQKEGSELNFAEDRGFNQGAVSGAQAGEITLSRIAYFDSRKDSVIVLRSFNPGTELQLFSWDHSLRLEFERTESPNDPNTFYSHKLEGFEKYWSEPSKVNYARFSMLPTGKYVFRVRSRVGAGPWNTHELALNLIVHPPWWASLWAYVVYASLLLALLLFVRRYEINRQTLKANLKMETLEAEKLKELDHFKSELYADLTHEFRTPLTVILGMVEQMKDNPKRYTDDGIKLIERNSKNLLHLINQLLDLSKLDNKAFKLYLQQSDIIPYLRYVTEAFQTFANSRNLALRFVPAIDSLLMDYDPEQVKQVLTNLISNAVKFTPSGGDISIKVSRKKNDLIIEVQDTGIGISEADLTRVFDRFYQAREANNRHREGTGIGLAHTKELLNVMGGHIGVSSKLGEGSTFAVSIPISNNAALVLKEDYSRYQVLPVASTSAEEKPDQKEKAPNKSLPHLLIIEDNPDVVIYLKTCLEDQYQVGVAYNGEIGIRMALDSIPDLIISDLMMPEKDGYDVCNTLKNDERTSHIPIILLTAKTDAASKISGLRRGADAYLIKPFDKEELLVRLEMLVQRQKRMVAHFSRELHASIKPDELHTGAEEAIQVENTFMHKLQEIVEKNYDDEGFSLTQLCHKIGMSRSQLFRKLQALSGTSPSDYIRSYRLGKAKILLQSTDLNVSEVAWKVGYKDPAHFSKSYQEEFGFPPSATER